MDLEAGDVVLCTVDRIVGTTVFVRIEGDGEGSIVFSEVAPGRIRNIRDYVVPKKQIVCKVLRISGDRIDLSFRRVTLKEQKEVKERSKLEKSYESIMRNVLGEKAIGMIESIKKIEKIVDFLQEARENPERLEKIAGKEDTRKIIEIINSQQKQKKATIKKEIGLKSMNPDGIEAIKGILESIKGIEIRYLSAGRYSLSKEDADMKEADQKLREAMETIEKKAKKDGLDFSILKK